MNERFIQRRVLESGGNHSTHGTNNAPDRPQLSTRKFKMGYARKGIPYSGPSVEITKPLTPFREIPIRGRVTVGGGTSSEALRRARKNQARKRS